MNQWINQYKLTNKHKGKTLPTMNESVHKNKQTYNRLTEVKIC